MKNFILLIALTFAIFGNVYGQTKKIVEGGIVNGKATYLPQSDYPQEAKDFCASVWHTWHTFGTQNFNLFLQ